MVIILASIACSDTAPAGGVQSPDSGDSEDPCLTYTATCEFPAGFEVDLPDSRQFALTLTPFARSGEVEDPPPGSGRASLDDEGILSWDAAPGGAVLVVEESGLGFYADATRSVDGGTVDGCSMMGTDHWVIAARWTADGGFAGTWTLSEYRFVGSDHCSYSVSYAAVATPTG